MKYAAIIVTLLLTGFGCSSVQQRPPIDGEVQVPASDGNIDTLEDGDTTISVEVSDDPTTGESYSVYEYFHLLPDDYYFFPEGEDRDLSIDVLDEENYYISLRPRSWEGWGSLAVFLHGGREYVFVEWSGCGPACEQWFYVLEYVDGAWIDHTAEIWTPAWQEVMDYVVSIEDQDPDNPLLPMFIIPRHGTTITVIDQFIERDYADIIWQDGAFHAQLKN